MKRRVSAFDSYYIIDGVQTDNTPGQLLNDCMACPEVSPEDGAVRETIVDEIVDPSPTIAKYDFSDPMRYTVPVMERAGKNGNGRCLYPESYARRRIAVALTETLWLKGHFSLEDIGVELSWSWDSSPLGNMAAFYRSAESAAGYLFDLSVKLGGYGFTDAEGETRIDVRTSVNGREEETDGNDDEYDFLDMKSGEEVTKRYCWVSDDLKCGNRLLTDNESDWLIYIPFDTCDFRLGGSAFEDVAGISGDPAPDMADPDYFMDCYEVIRELVEDGVVVAGRTVGPGGLAAAAAAMCGEDGGINMDVSGIEAAYSEKNIMRILYSEIPGVLIQIRDDDYDYVDSQMLLQDLAYYPLGHPDRTLSGPGLVSGRRPAVSDILASLIQSQASEGED